MTLVSLFKRLLFIFVRLLFRCLLEWISLNIGLHVDDGVLSSNQFFLYSLSLHLKFGSSQRHRDPLLLQFLLLCEEIYLFLWPVFRAGSLTRCFDQ